MLSVLVVLYYNTILAGTAGTPIMDFEMSPHGNKECLSKYITLYEGQPLEIRYSNAFTLRCLDWSKKYQIIFQKNRIQNDFSVATVDKVPNFGNKWICEFMDIYTNVLVRTCIAFFHLQTIQPRAQLFVDNKQAVAKPAYSSSWQYDAVASYSFVEDEAVNIECRGLNDRGSAKITHYNFTGERTETFSTDYLYITVSIFLKLTKEYDRSHVLCSYNDGSDVSVTRLNLYLQNPVSPQSLAQSTSFEAYRIPESFYLCTWMTSILADRSIKITVDSGCFDIKNINAGVLQGFLLPRSCIITLHINGLKIRIQPYGINYHHQHIYYEEEEARITCEIRNDTNLFLQFYKENWQTQSDPRKVNETLSFKNKNYVVYFICAATDREKHVVKESVNIQFIQNKHDFYVTGLFRSNILKQYPENRKSLVIYYEYTNGELLNLMCTKIRTTAISFEISLTLDGENERSTITTFNNKIHAYHVFALQARHNNSVIKYMGHDANNFHQQITIRLIHKKTPVIVNPDNHNGNNDNGTDNENNASGNNDNGKHNKNNGSGNNNNSKNKENDDSGNYDKSTNNENDANDGNNESLNVFITKHWITLSVGIGTLIIIIIITCVVFKNKMNKGKSSNSNYTSVPSRGNSCNESRQLVSPIEQLYSNGMMNHDDQIEPVLHYAEIMPTNNKAKFTKTSAPEYAQILSKDKKTNRNENDYENICNTVRYVNCQDGKELVEPLYCEVLSAHN